MVVDGGEQRSGRLRAIVGISGGVYLCWWFMVELLLPGSFNPLAGRLLVVALDGVLLAASYRSRWVARNLPSLFTAWTCLLVGHYTYLIVGNRGEPTWWVGAFVTFAAASMCMQSRRDVGVFSLFAIACAIGAAVAERQLGDSIYVPGLVTILLLANITKHSQTLARDATAQAEDARKATRSSNEQRLQLAAIVESSGDAIVARSLEGLVRSWNSGAERLFGYAAEDMIGRPVSLLAAPGGPEDDAEELARMALLAKGEAVASFEAVRRRKDGSDVHVSVTLSPIRDSRGDIVGASMAARDISEWKRAQVELVRAREAADGANRELEAFNYSVAHDLRAPLRAVEGFSRALHEDCGQTLDTDGQRHLQRVRAAAEHMGRLIDSMLALGQVARAGVRNEEVDLCELARKTASRLQEAEPDRVVDFVIGEQYLVRGDSALLGAVVENLLSNAWKFSRGKTGARIELGAIRERRAVTYFVRDNGAGFDMAFASRLFVPFQRLHSATEFEGTGVGLATVQRIVHSHGGRVWATGIVGEGACFYWTLGDATA